MGGSVSCVSQPDPKMARGPIERADGGFAMMHQRPGLPRTSGTPHTQMIPADVELPEREGTAEIMNDPRMFGENVIDRRLAAFEAIAIVTEIMAAEAVKFCFELGNEYSFVGELYVISVLQLIGLTLMVIVMFMDLVACAVLSLQMFFTIRLMTAGPTGFDKAARFYTDQRMWRWRERAIFSVKWGIVLFAASTGLMLCVKFYIEGAPEVEEETEKQHDEEYQGHKILAGCCFSLFAVLTAVLCHLMKQHQRVFDESYCSTELCLPGELHGQLLPSLGIH
eukprot:TRINITY_DN11527_c0_g1_i1.p1 TRINITY_DN11527_c0_g1~~TRINITY_DN11527_c0_g1_i1.p1  ORF type:complete len:280 (+),score=49.68 TRINITY_DN11527_c0_g1_i1:103-942(+)